MHVFMRVFVAFLATLAGLALTADSSFAASPLLTVVYSGNNYGNYQPCPS
jgi:hypothetical protein